MERLGGLTGPALATGKRMFTAQELAAPLEDGAIDVTDEGDASRLVFRPKQDGGAAAA